MTERTYSKDGKNGQFVSKERVEADPDGTYTATSKPDLTEVWVVVGEPQVDNVRDWLRNAIVSKAYLTPGAAEHAMLTAVEAETTRIADRLGAGVVARLRISYRVERLEVDRPAMHHAVPGGTTSDMTEEEAEDVRTGGGW